MIITIFVLTLIATLIGVAIGNSLSLIEEERNETWDSWN